MEVSKIFLLKHINLISFFYFIFTRLIKKLGEYFIEKKIILIYILTKLFSKIMFFPKTKFIEKNRHQHIFFNIMVINSGFVKLLKFFRLFFKIFFLQFSRIKY